MTCRRLRYLGLRCISAPMTTRASLFVQARRVCIVSSLVLLVASGPGVSAKQNPASASGDVRLLPVQGSVSMVVGAGANITVQAGDDGILLVDTGLAEVSEKVLDLIWPLSKKPLVYI